MEKHHSCVNTRAIIEYFREQAPQEVDRLFSGLGPEIDQLTDPQEFLMEINNWVSSQVVIKMFDNAREISGDDDIAFKIGFDSAARKKLGYIQRIILFAYRNPRRSLRQVQKINDKFNRNKRIELVSTTRDRALVRLHWFPEIPATIDFCLFNKGIYTGIPTVWNLPPAILDETKCWFKGDDYCEYHLKWVKRYSLKDALLNILVPWRALNYTIEELEKDKELLRKKFTEIHVLNIELKEKLTQLLQLQGSLQESEARFRNLLEYIPGMAVQGYATDGTVRYWNKASEELYGYTVEEAVGKSLADLTIPPELTAIFQKGLELGARASHSGEFMPSGENSLLTKTGSRVPVYSIHTVVCLEGSEPLMFSIDVDLRERKRVEEELRNYRDHLEMLVEERTAQLTLVNQQLHAEIEERRRAEQALSESEREFRNIVETAQEGIWVIDAEEKTSYVNRRLTEMLGYRAEDMLGRSLFEFMNEAVRQEARENLKATYGGRPEVLEFNFRRHDGTDLWTIISTNPLFDDQGRYIGALGMLTDITERRLAEAALRESEVRFRTVFEGAPVGVGLIDLDWQILEINLAFTKILGYSLEELRRVGLANILHPDEIASAKMLFDELLRGERDFYQREGRYRRKDGTWMWGSVHNSIIRDDRDKPQFIVSMMADITQEKEAQAEISAYQERLRALASELSLTEERERRRLAADLHDHIGQILALAQIKLGAVRQEASTLEGQAAVSEVRDFIGQAIRYSRSLTYELGLPILYDLGLEAALEWLAEQMQEQHGLKIEVHRGQQPHNLGEAARVLVFRVVRELLTNVVKHAQASRVDIFIARKGSYLQLQVADDGVGFDSDLLGARAGESKGYGLFSIRERLGSLGGHLEITSQPGQGTQVVISVPLERQEAVMN